jgi:hypothetical protein
MDGAPARPEGVQIDRSRRTSVTVVASSVIAVMSISHLRRASLASIVHERCSDARSVSRSRRERRHLVLCDDLRTGFVTASQNPARDRAPVHHAESAPRAPKIAMNVTESGARNDASSVSLAGSTSAIRN